MNYNNDFKISKEQNEMRKSQLVTSIKSNKDDITKNTLLAAGAALAVGAGSIGIYYFGPDVIGKYFSSEVLTFKSNFLWKLKGSGLGFSVLMTGQGLYRGVVRITNIVGDVKSLNSKTKELSELESKEKRKSL